MNLRHQIVDLEAELERQQDCTLAILRDQGISATCHKCGEIIFRLYSPHKLNTREYNPNGMLHWITCKAKKP